MKKNYKDLEYEVVRFEEEDVITASEPALNCACNEVSAFCPDKNCNCVGVEK